VLLRRVTAYGQDLDIPALVAKGRGPRDYADLIEPSQIVNDVFADSITKKIHCWAVTLVTKREDNYRLGVLAVDRSLFASVCELAIPASSAVRLVPASAHRLNILLRGGGLSMGAKAFDSDDSCSFACALPVPTIQDMAE
jgi:urease beta subunit